MGTVIGLLCVWMALLEINRTFEKREFKRLKREIQDLRSVIQRRQDGQSWERIKQDDEETELIRRYMGIND